MRSKTILALTGACALAALAGACADDPFGLYGPRQYGYDYDPGPAQPPPPGYGTYDLQPGQTVQILGCPVATSREGCVIVVDQNDRAFALIGVQNDAGAWGQALEITGRVAPLRVRSCESGTPLEAVDVRQTAIRCAR